MMIIRLLKIKFIYSEKAPKIRRNLQTFFDATNGQLISKCPFGVIVLIKKPTIFLRSSALASKKWLNQKNIKIKALYLFFN